MKFVNCPKCGELINKKVQACPKCNLSFLRQNLIWCKGCGATYCEDLCVCPNCGLSKTTSKKVKKRRSISAFFLIIAFCLSILGVYMIFNVVETKKNELEYCKNIETAADTIIAIAVKAEETGAVWARVGCNADSETRDYITDKYSIENGKFVSSCEAVSNFRSSNYYRKKVSEIRELQKENKYLMKQLRNPPKKYKDTYYALLACDINCFP